MENKKFTPVKKDKRHTQKFSSNFKPKRKNGPKKQKVKSDDSDFIEIDFSQDLDIDDKPEYSTKEYKKPEIDTSGYEKITGVYSQAKNNDFGFIDIEGSEKGIFVYPKNLGLAMDGDTVEAYVKVFKGRKEAVVTDVIKRADRVLVGTVELVKDFAFVILDNKNFKRDIYVPYKNLTKLKGKIHNGLKVAIKITKWEGKNPEGFIYEILGEKNDKGIDILGLALESGVRINFPEAVIEDSKKLKYRENKRKDLTKDLIYTIDGEDAKDLDDAIGVEKVENSYKLIVSIADVADYVLENSSIDKEALKRGNSTYLADRVIPMLPEKLSNDLCSLNPNTKKLTLTCEMILDNEGFVTSKKVYESIISSKFRLTYKEVQEIIESKLNIGDKLKFGGTISKELIESILLANELKIKVSKRKRKSGVLDFDFPETKIILDKEGNPTGIEKLVRYESMKLIEEFMILANESVGELFSDVPFVYRVHPVPNDDDVEKLRNTLNIFGIALPHKDLTPSILSKILVEIKNNPKEKLLSKMILRSLEKAIYSDENVGHFGLGIKFYSHFTSPIRRYSDLQIHRIIKEKIHKTLTFGKIRTYKNILPEICKKVSDTERVSERLEYAVRDLMVAKYYSDKIGMSFEGMVSGMIPAGFFVELENTAEGFVNIEDMMYKNKLKGFDYDEINMKFIFNDKLNIQVGDKIKINISKVDIERRRVDFEFVSKI